VGFLLIWVFGFWFNPAGGSDPLVILCGGVVV